MNTIESKAAIRRETALAICEEIREENRHRLFSRARLQCWGCITFSKGEAEKMRLSSQPGYRGCDQVNHRYEQDRWASALEQPEDCVPRVPR